MPRSTNPHRPDRRSLLAGGVAAGFSLFLGPAAFAAAARAPFARREDDEGPILVVLQLTGGNDGLNTIVPYGDDLYAGARTELRVPTDKILKIDDYRGFNPLLGGLRAQYDKGQLAIVQGAGYPHPNRSHFASFDIWHAASERGRLAGDGWLARVADGLRGQGPAGVNLAVHVGNKMPYSLFSPSGSSVCFDEPGMYRWNRNEDAITGAAETDEMGDQGNVADEGNVAIVRNTFLQARESSASIRAAAEQYEPRVQYPESRLALDLRIAAALIQGGVGSRILSVELDGFDTHAKQGYRHDLLLKTWDSALSAFLEDLKGTPRGDRTVVLCFSEFGRRVKENASAGTDHGTAAPMFLVGPRVRGGLYGTYPSLADLDEGDLRFTTDFRSVYATVAEQWFGLDSTKVVAGTYPTLPVFA